MGAGATLKISSQLVKEIRQHGAEAYPEECCGALLGRESGGDEASTLELREILDVLPLPNRRRDSTGTRFLLTAEDVAEAEKAARAHGMEVVGWYHSHPDQFAGPSEFDRQNALPWYSYVIVSIRNGAPEDLTSWRLNDDRREYTQEAIEIHYGAAV